MDINKILKEKNFKFSKRYGQNFITDLNLLDAIVSDAKVEGGSVLEIGAGAGTLTLALAKKADRVLSYEIDNNLLPVLSKTLEDAVNVSMEFKDILKEDTNVIKERLLGSYKIVANLPYYITTPIIFNFLYLSEVESITVMVQKEVAERICAKAGTAAYGALSVAVQAYGEPKITRIVNRKLFTPAPDVDSAIVHIKIEPMCERELEPLLRRVIQSAFAMRRKTLVNNLMAGFSFSRTLAEKYLTDLNLSLTARGETLSPNQFIKLTRLIASKQN